MTGSNRHCARGARRLCGGGDVRQRAISLSVARLRSVSDDLCMDLSIAIAGPTSGDASQRAPRRSPMRPRSTVVVVFESFDKAKAWSDSDAIKAIRPIRDRSAKVRTFLVEGVVN